MDSPPAKEWRWWPVVAMAVAAVALVAFVIAGRDHRVGFGFFLMPPVYGYWLVPVDPLALIGVPVGLIVTWISWWVTSRRVPTGLALGLLIIAGVGMAAAIALVHGRTGDLTRGVTNDDPKFFYYSKDLHLVDEYGVRGFVENHPQLSALFASGNAKTHPPGILLLLNALFQLFDSAFVVATAIAVLSMAAAISAWSIARTLGGEPAGRIAAALTVAAPGMLILAYGSMDGVYATLLSAAAAVFMIAIARRSFGWGILAGVVLGIGTFFTYATVFVALAAALAILVQRAGVRVLAAAALGGLAVLVALRIGLGWDLLADYATVPDVARPYDAYWILGSPAAWLIYAGLPLAGLGIAGLFVPGAHRPVLPAILIAIMIIWATLPPEFTHLRPGEVERTWAFLYPILAACAGPVIDRWTVGKRRRGVIIAGLVMLSLAQAVLVQALWDNVM